MQGLGTTHLETTTVQGPMDFSVALVSVVNPNKHYAQNKDLNGGFGTADDYQGSVFAYLVRSIKKNVVHLPVLAFAYLQAILKQKGCRVRYYEGVLPDPARTSFDLILLNGSIVDYIHENDVARRLKNMFPTSKIGFFGDFPTVKPDLFSGADFVILGEVESFFMNDFKNLQQMHGHVRASSLTNYDAMPVMDLEGFNLEKYRYSMFFPKRFITYQGSKGCPYSCSYYCTYGKIQGPKIRQRSVEKIVADILFLQTHYGINHIQFRDPVFGLNKGFIEEFCAALKQQDVHVQWGMETRLDLLTTEKIDLMKEVGLRLINVGIETTDPEVAQKNKRLLIKSEHQEKIIRYCAQKNIKICAFYILGLETDTVKTIAATLKYAKHLNTPIARFSVATPYPGTMFYDQLQREGKILTTDFEKYSQFNLVFKHQTLTPVQVQKILILTYLRYYIRLRYIVMVILYQCKKFQNRQKQ